jgi:serine protease Do
MKKTLILIIGIVLGGIITLTSYQLLGNKAFSTTRAPFYSSDFRLAANAADSVNNVFRVGFGEAAEKILDQVVHIRSSARVASNTWQFYNLPDPLRDFFGDDFWSPRSNQEPRNQLELREATGSGVIISADGYIVTNNHVIDGADEVEVSLHNRKTYRAKVVGTDPSTDLALLKIDATKLPYATLANSDLVKVGDWVLAVGNPFNLSSTVTAGIVSAKARNINILRTKDNSAIESFIQTDAAVNPGNSGGALVNLKGEVVGINTAIATPTGLFAGYSFAVPSNIVAKVMEDFIKHGKVQRAYLGVMIKDLDWATAKELDLDFSEGVVVDSLVSKGAADLAGIKKNDVIVKIDNNTIRSSAELLETVGRHRPGDVIAVTVNRDGKEKEFKVKLKNSRGEEAIAKAGDRELFEDLGAEFADLSDKEKKKLGIDGGVRVTKLFDGKLSHFTEIREGFIITKIDNDPVKNTADLKKKMESKKGGVLIEGIYPDLPGKFYYGIGAQS